MANNKNNSEQVILNRRLKPIYDAVDNGNNKKAIQEAEKLLKKHPQTFAAKGLKALALVRSERTAEAWPLVEECDEYVRKGNFDQNTIQLVVHCYKEAYVPSRIASFLEDVNKQFPGCENLLKDLFVAYVRVKDYKNQQRVAQLLSKEFHSSEYLYWTISSLVMQALNNETMGSKVFFPLAQKMFEKALSNNEKPTRTESSLYVQILEGQQKYKEVYDYLKGQLEKQNLNLDDVKMKIIETLNKLKEYEKVVKECSVCLEQNNFDLQIWQEVLKVLEQVKDDEKLRQGVLTSIQEMIKKVEQSVEKTYQKHSLLIIKCMYLKQLHSLNLDSNSYGGVLQNLKALIDTSLDKPYCFKEMAQFLGLISDKEKEELLNYVKEKVEGDNDKLTYPEMMHELLRCTYGQIQTESAEERRKYSANLVEKLNKTKTEDIFLGMAVSLVISNVLWLVYIEEERVEAQEHQQKASQSQEAIQELAVYLEHIYSTFSNSYITAVLLIRVHGVLGNTNRVEKLLRQLDVKYIQKDSLAYLNFGLAEASGRFKEAIIQYTGISAFADANDREIGASYVAAYKSGTVDQIPELVEFSQNCNNSLYLVAADVANRIYSSCFAVTTLEMAVFTLQGDDQPIEFDKLKDTRDYNVLNSIAFYNQDITEEVRKATFEEMLDMVEFRHYLCRVVSDIGWEDIPLDVIQTNFKLFKNKLEQCKLKYPTAENCKHLQGFIEPSWTKILSSTYLNLIIKIAEGGCNLFQIEENTKESTEKASKNVIETLNSLDLTPIVPEHKGEGVTEQLKDYSYAITTLALIQLMVKFVDMKIENLLVANQCLKTPFEKKCNEAFKSVQEMINGICKKMEDGLNALKQEVSSSEAALLESEYYVKLGLNDSVYAIDKDLTQSQTQSINDMIDSLSRIKNILSQFKFDAKKI
ncbi:unnamed protein product [Bursaphelenchus okinawaensis]|uniref:N-terminal acetyltransferase B complex subunit NAA25 homolog n=1 Tax=Bursaphelenchus okinawaensis TaxID=465554 RepID=A0A811JVK7_9BILA|nr:unnamed protein product [Bursaphelenchus okinawaensis]CAG9085212.1 unnamed protein product [Bursaphelenchus okinawaensis]